MSGSSAPWCGSFRASTIGPVVVVGGNHEYWSTDIDVTLDKARKVAAGTNVSVLERDIARIGSLTILGTTGWTDFKLFDDPQTAMLAAFDGMNDYKRIRKNFYADRLRPVDTLRRHEATRAFIAAELAKRAAATNP
ncbi:hypothetical protein [Nitrobacter winogradskyi]|nr:hypothetical protein [Nitrobacter winogradskyi]MCP2001406.1 putative phosphohydrolase [Nitrobacter winogradskyi]